MSGVSAPVATLFLLGIFVLSYALAGWYRRYALRRDILDIPNARSSHFTPVPRGGGVSFVLVFLGASLFFFLFFPERDALWLALVGGGGGVALLGWLDDRYDLSSGRRFLFQGLAAAWALYWLGGLPTLTLGSAVLELGWLGYPLAWLGIMWMLNLYNFMDGIDGLTSGQGVLVAVTVSFLLLLTQHNELAFVTLTLGGAILGFLVWNWPPAKIFMGDVGSGFLGFIFALLAVYSENSGALPLLGWFALFAVFFVDTTATLVLRTLRGERWYEAHNTHAYQKAVQAGLSHRQVTITILLIGAALSVVTLIGTLQPTLLLPLVALAVAALFMLWWAISVRGMLKARRDFIERGKQL